MILNVSRLLGRTSDVTTKAFFPIWLEVKNILPALITGAYDKQTGDENAGGALYNLVFVRLPTIVIGA